MTYLTVALCFVLLTGCHGHSHEDAEPHGHGHGHEPADERPDLSFTHWTQTSELFMELPALVRGQPSACAAHVTKLEGFSALSEGRVTVVLRGGAKDERFESAGPTVPGIFRPVAKPASAGKRRLLVEIRASGFTADHDLGEVTVFESVAAARAAHPEEPEAAGRITFLKEQQWPIAFATAVVTEQPMRPALRATGEIRARPDGEVVVTAQVAGRVATSAGRAFPRLGERVTVDDLLGVLAPRLEAADLASLELAVTSANLELRFAEREQQRLEGLRSEGAVPERRVQDAVHAGEEAQASLGAAQRRLDQFRRVQRTAGRGEGTVQLRAPLSGTITEVHVAPGAFVEAGAPLFRVTDLTQLWLEARIAESDVARLGTPSGASFVVEGSEPVELPAEALLARTHVIDPISRTLSLMFAVDNASARLPVGSYASVFISHGDPRQALVVPELSLVDDNGMFVVFVQVEGEAFERRMVRVGARDRGRVEILSGVREGEHVVTVGAWSVKLAASSGAVPAHGHSH